jgi:hypothetical protein
MSERDANFADRLLALDGLAAAMLLLRCGAPVDGQYADMYEGAQFTKAEPTVAPIALEGTSSFERVNRVLLRDNAPGDGKNRPKSSILHQFVLGNAQASDLNAQLRRDAVELSQSTAGLRVSNVGGFHSATEIFDPNHDGVWYGALSSLLLEALRLVHHDGHVDGCLIENLYLRGWANVSLSSDFNQSHDHGAVTYSVRALLRPPTAFVQAERWWISIPCESPSDRLCTLSTMVDLHESRSPWAGRAPATRAAAVPFTTTRPLS